MQFLDTLIFRFKHTSLRACASGQASFLSVTRRIWTTAGGVVLPFASDMSIICATILPASTATCMLKSKNYTFVLSLTLPCYFYQGFNACSGTIYSQDEFSANPHRLRLFVGSLQPIATILRWYKIVVICFLRVLQFPWLTTR